MCDHIWYNINVVRGGTPRLNKFLKENRKMEKIQDMIHIEYRAYAQEPFALDASGYIRLLDLRPLEDGTDCDSDEESAMTDGWKAVKTDDDEWYAAQEKDIYTEVHEESALSSGYGKSHPTGGETSCEAPTHYTEITRDERDPEAPGTIKVMLINDCW
jgi:hypothetical protein